MLRATVLIAALVMSPLLAVAAQEDKDLAPGTRVRVTTSDEIYEATILVQGSDSLRLQAEGDSAPFSVARLAITEIAVSGGRHSHAGTGALIGLGIGAVGGAVTVAYLSACDGFFCGPTDDGTSVVVPMVFGAGLALVGALFGSQFTSERWEQVPLHHLHATIGHGGPGLALSLTF